MKVFISSHMVGNDLYKLFKINDEYYLYVYGVFENPDFGMLQEHGTKQKCLDYLEELK